MKEHRPCGQDLLIFASGCVPAALFAFAQFAVGTRRSFIVLFFILSLTTYVLIFWFAVSAFERTRNAAVRSGRDSFARGRNRLFFILHLIGAFLAGNLVIAFVHLFLADPAWALFCQVAGWFH